MSIEHLQRLKSLEAAKTTLEARVEKLEAYLWGEEVNDDTDDFDHATVPQRKRGRPRKEQAA